jgi:nitrate/TMAO reductase-like tetraheme cytochrome c subunit
MNNLKKLFRTLWGRLSIGKRPKEAGAKAPLWRKLLGSVGIHVMHHKKWSVHLAPRFFLAIGVCMAFGIVGGAGITVYSTSPGFCKSCHIMKPYYVAWENSPHREVSCVKCHYPPGKANEILWLKFQALSQVAKYVTRTYSSKPYAEVEDASCLRSGCHSKRLLDGNIETKTGIKFDHRPHLLTERKGRQLRCVSCHSQMVMGKHVDVTWDTCYLCHLKERGEGRELNPLGGCTGCHTIPEQNIKIGNMSYSHKEFVSRRGVSCTNCHLDVVSGKGEAGQDRCFTCHNEPDKILRIKDIEFIHDNHVTEHKVACFHCHSELRHGFVDDDDDQSRMARIDEKARELDDKSVSHHGPSLHFECSYCHLDTHGGQLELYSGQVASLGLPEMPSPMFSARVGCVGCHYRKDDTGAHKYTGAVFLSSSDSCVKCHGPEFKGMWSETSRELRATMKAVGLKFPIVRKALAEAKLPKKKKRQLKAKFTQAETRHAFLKAAHGEHNIYLASEILRREDEALSEIAEAVGANLPDTTEDPLLSGNYCAKMCHQSAGVKVPPVEVRYKGRRMPHQAHTEFGGCVSCHEIGAHKKVDLKKNHKEFCVSCHEV